MIRVLLDWASMLEGDTADADMMLRCIELSRLAIDAGELPFGTVIAYKGRILAESINRTKRDKDIARHAEVMALAQAQKVLGREQMRHATLYSNVEPCAMCSYCIREAWVGRVVYSLSSPVMGGLSKWNILRDEHLSDRAPIFGPPPEIVSGLLAYAAQKAWADWSTAGWEMIKLRGVLAPDCAKKDKVEVLPAHPKSLWHHILLLFARGRLVERT